MTTPAQETVSIAPVNSTVTYPSTTTALPETITVVTPPTQYFTAEDMERARQQEKDKLYGRLQQQEQMLSEFKTSVEELQKDKADRESAAEKARKAAADAEKREQESKLSAEELIRAKEAELTAKQDEFSKQMELKIATMEKEQEFLRLQSYIQRRVAEEIAANTIIPDLVEFIGGNSEDEVEAAITKVKEKTANIVQGAATLTAPQMPIGTSPTSGPAGPLDTLSGPKQYTREEIDSMSMQEYALFRQKQGIAGAGQNRGMFN